MRGLLAQVVVTDEMVERVAIRAFNDSPWSMAHLAGTADPVLWDHAAEDLREQWRRRAAEYLSAALEAPDGG